MASLQAEEGYPGRHAQRCAVCDADVLFLAVCPACGTPTDVDPDIAAEARAKKVSAATAAGTVSFADAARARAKGPLPDELIRAWQPPSGRGSNLREATQPPPVQREQRKSDDWTSAAPGTAARSARRGVSRRLLLGAGALVVVAGAVSIGAVELSQRQDKARLTAPTLSAPTSYVARGLPFTATFPTRPAVSRDHLRLLRSRYTATMYTSTSGSTSVTVGVYPFPLGKAGNPRHFLRTFVSGGGAALGGTTFHASATTTVQGLPAVWLASTVSGGSAAGFGVVVLDGHIAYEVLASGPASTVDTTFQRVMRDFKINDPAKGIVF